KKTPIATSWTIPLRTGSEPTPTVGGLGIGTGGYRAARHVPPLRLILAAAAVAAFAAATYAPVASTRSADAPVTLAFAGDVHFEGAVRTTLLSRSRTVLGAMAPTLGQADLAVVNLETAVTDRGTAQSKQYVFRAPASAFDALRNGGVDVATMA